MQSQRKILFGAFLVALKMHPNFIVVANKITGMKYNFDTRY